MKKFITKFYKWIIALFIGVSVFGTGVVFDKSKEIKIPNNLKIKAPKEKILESKDIDWIIEKEDGTIENKGKIKSYDYVTDKKVKGDFIFKKPSYSNTKIISEKKTASSTEYVVKYYSGDHFYKDDKGDIYQIEQGATTTINAFEEQTKETLSEKISKLFFGDKALAACGDSGGNCYANAGDGRAYKNSGTWQQMHDATTGDGANYGAETYISIINRSNAIYRGFFTFDTSALPDTAVITGADLYIWGYFKQNDLDNDLDYIAIAESNQTNNESVITTDYGECGESLANGWSSAYSDDIIIGSDKIDLDVINTSGHQKFTFDATGLGFINLTGYSKFCYREGNDFEDNSPAAANRWGVRTTAYTGTTSDPYLTITYTTGGAAEEPKQIITPIQPSIY